MFFIGHHNKRKSLGVYPHKLFRLVWFAKYFLQRRPLKDILYQPSFELFILVEGRTGAQLKICLDSIFRQSYPRFHVSLLAAAEAYESAQDIVRTEYSGDKRIALFHCYDIDKAIKKIITKSDRHYIHLTDAYGKLDKHALLAVVDALNAPRNLKPLVVYSDEDLVDRDNRHFFPHFKSGWNPDLFFCTNYLANSVFINTSIFKKQLSITDIEGSSYGLTMYAVANSVDASIRHIPKVLYHRQTSMSAEHVHLQSMTHKKQTLQGVVKQRLGDQKEGFKVLTGFCRGSYRIKYQLPNADEPMVTLIIPTRDQAEILEKCIHSILCKTNYQKFEILIVDNQSSESKTQRYFETLAQNPKIRIIKYDRRFNYAALNNYAVKFAKGSVLGFVNNDIEVINKSWMQELVSQACRKEIGCVGAKLYYPDGSIQHGGVIIGMGGIADHAHKYLPGKADGYFCRLRHVQSLSAVTGACLFLRTELFQQVGGFEEKLTMAYNDVDLCLKVRSKGFRNLWTPHAELYHHESVTRGRNDTRVNAKRFADERSFMKKRWGSELFDDPYYNLNLSSEQHDFSVRKLSSLLKF